MRFGSSKIGTLHSRFDGKPDGIPLVFINSLGSDLRIWENVIPTFADDFRILRYDKYGHGLSDIAPSPFNIRDHAATLTHLLDAYEIDKAVIVGISVGGMIAMDFAVQNPDSTQALVLLDTFPTIGTPEMWNTRINTLRERGMESLGNTILERWFSPTFNTKDPAAYRGYYNMLTRMPVAGYTGTCEAIRDADLTQAAKTIKAPTLVLCGAEDASTPPDLVRGLTEIIPNSRYVEIEAAGHLPCVEQPQATANAIGEFLKEVL